MSRKLPDKPSKLLKLALTDLEKVQKDPQYRVDMGYWHKTFIDLDSNTYPKKCGVCAAGSVMAKSLHQSPEAYLDPEDFDEDTKLKLYAINEFREGDIAGALAEMGIDIELYPALPDNYSLNYDPHLDDDDDGVILGKISVHDIEEWKLHMQTIIGMLEAEGL